VEVPPQLAVFWPYVEIEIVGMGMPLLADRKYAGEISAHKNLVTKTITICQVGKFSVYNDAGQVYKFTTLQVDKFTLGF
jgi:hypothetical protein